MKDGEVDYSKYTLRELKEAFEGINAGAWPKNYANLRSAYESLTSSLPPPPGYEAPPVVEESEAELPPEPKFDEDGRYVPNHIPGTERRGYILFSLGLAAYGAYGVRVNDLYLPGKRGGLHLHDLSAWIMFGAFICACLVMLVVVVDHYDRRNNEVNYWFAGRVLRGIGWILFGLSLAVGVLQEVRG